MPKIKRAIISVSDKKDIVWFARELSLQGVEIISTGGTYKILGQEGIKVIPVVEVTSFPEMLDGRVKTLHPKIHGGILADRNKPEHMRQLEYQKIQPIDMVVVNLYPFKETVSKPGFSRAEAIEQIDIGGPAMLRAAAKNHEHVAVVVNPERYPEIIKEMKERDGELSEETRRLLAVEAFRHTAEYDRMIWEYLSSEQELSEAQVANRAGARTEDEGLFPSRLELAYDRKAILRYGENPHQSAALYSERPPVHGSLANSLHLSGPQLSFNNLLDADSAWKCALDFPDPVCVIVKHNNPCGIAVHQDLAQAYRRALECDPVSAYGSVIAFNRKVTEACANAMRDLFIEVLVAPGYYAEALEILKEKKDLRILSLEGWGFEKGDLRDYKKIDGGLLVQDMDTDACDPRQMRVVTKREPSEREWKDLIFAWRSCKHVRSNAIVLARNLATVGIGAGQMSRVDAAAIAVEKAGSDRTSGCVAASDAFFPFADAVQKIAEAGAVAIIQPGGSIRDDEVIELCERYQISMVFTGKRHFRH